MTEPVNFGDQLVSPEEKTRRVGQVFSSVARRYDLMNDLMSGGMHRLWKDRFVSRVKPRAGERILDLAGGTGDVAVRLARRGALVTVADINPDMLEAGQARAEAGDLARLTRRVENADALSFGACRTGKRSPRSRRRPGAAASASSASPAPISHRSSSG